MVTPNIPPGRVVIVGAGHAGGTAAAQLRQNGFTGPLTLIGEEPVPPYQRPPLSKAWLSGDTGLDQVLLRPAGWYEGQDIDLRTGHRVGRIDREARAVLMSDATAFRFDALILATGAVPRALTVPGGDLGDVHVLRSVNNADALKGAIGAGVRVVCVGAGYIGLEIAASARKAGASVTVVEREARSLARVACAPVARLLEARHDREGVAFRLGAAVAEIEGAAGRVTAVRLESGEVLPADVVVAGIGVIPDDTLAREAGLACGDGIHVDDETRTSDPSIFAIGDVAHRPIPFAGCQGRLESVPNALEQARICAAVLTGKPLPKAEVPWFWSDQYDLKIQIAGLPAPGNDIVLRGAGRTDPPFAAFHVTAEGAVAAVEAVGDVPAFMIGRRLIANGTPVDRDILGDPSSDLKSLL